MAEPDLSLGVQGRAGEPCMTVARARGVPHVVCGSLGLSVRGVS